MKLNFTHLLAILLLFISYSTKAQTLNQAAMWPNLAWSVTGSYTSGGLIDDPTLNSTFLFDDDAAGFGSIDEISAESPVIDLTAANTAGEYWISVSTSYVYREISGVLSLEYWDADASMWVNWEDFNPNSSNYDYTTCANQQAYMSSNLDVFSFSATQLSGFKYRFHYDDMADWNWGFCIASPFIASTAPPSCLDPTNLGVANVTTSGADLLWTGSGTVISYNIAIDTSGFALSGSSTSVLMSPYTIGGLTSATLYDFYVQTVCGTDSSNWSGPFTFSTLADFCGGDHFYDTGGPNSSYSSNETSITTICADNPGDNVTVTFSSFDVETNWDALYVFNGPDTNSTLIASANGPTQSNFPAGGYYGTTNPGPFYSSNPSGCLTFLFRSDASVNENGWDATVVCGSSTCSAPSSLAAVNITENSANLTWTGSGTAVGYYIAIDTTGFILTGSGTAVSASPYAAAGLSPGTSYDFYVLADCGFGLSSWTGPFTFSTLLPCPTNVTLPGDTTICTNQSITLDAGSGPYTYFWSTGATTQTIIVDSASFGGAGTYNISVTVNDTINNCSDGDTIVVVISICSGINNLASSIDAQVYPNPSNGLFYLQLNTAELKDLVIEILDIHGKQIYTSKIYGDSSKLNEEIDLRNQSKGLYFIHIYNNSASVYKKVLIE